MKQLSIDNYILLNYKNKTNAQMALELGCNKGTISNHRKKLGISKTDLNNELRSHVDYICKQYGRKTKTQLAKELNCSASFIKKIWEEDSLIKTFTQTYRLNDKYFATIDTHEKSYWLGFIAADGNLYRRDGHQGLISIGVKDCDIDILKEFKSQLDTDKPISLNKDKRSNMTMATLQITSDILFNDLLKIGIGIRKTFDLDVRKIINNIPKQFWLDFILGYFDGDGSIDIPNNNTISKSHIRISGPIKSLKIFKEVLEKIDINCTIIIDSRKYTEPFGSLELCSTSEKYAFLKAIYNSNIKCLNRKKQCGLELMRRIEKNVTHRSENIEAVKKYKSVVIKWGELLGR